MCCAVSRKSAGRTRLEACLDHPQRQLFRLRAGSGATTQPSTDRAGSSRHNLFHQQGSLASPVEAVQAQWKSPLGIFLVSSPPALSSAGQVGAFLLSSAPPALFTCAKPGLNVSCSPSAALFGMSFTCRVLCSRCRCSLSNASLFVAASPPSAPPATPLHCLPIAPLATRPNCSPCR